MNIKIIFEMFSKWPTAASIAVMLYPVFIADVESQWVILGNLTEIRQTKFYINEWLNNHIQAKLQNVITYPYPMFFEVRVLKGT